ncbi:MAG: ATP-binding protein [Clostridia bacterium]|nr:ATP-binding protein [Clostridia bacterium]
MPPKIILLCGKLCAGKTTYARRLAPELGAVILSVDEIMLSLFGQHLGDDHDRVAALTRDYLYRKSLEILDSGIPVILDWGFWTRDDRMATRAFYESRGLSCELHYIDVSRDGWEANIAARNALVEADPTAAYYVDENLLRKLEGRFQPPDEDETDVRVSPAP